MNIRRLWDSHRHLRNIRICWRAASQLSVTPAPVHVVTDYDPGPGFMHKLFLKYYAAGVAVQFSTPRNRWSRTTQLVKVGYSRR